jgi:predicted CoA-binding protein
LKGQVDGLLTIVPSTQAMQALREAITLGLNKIWLQQDAESSETLAQAKELGLAPVSGKCIPLRK